MRTVPEGHIFHNHFGFHKVSLQRSVVNAIDKRNNSCNRLKLVKWLRVEKQRCLKLKKRIYYRYAFVSAQVGGWLTFKLGAGCHLRDQLALFNFFLILLK